MFRNFASGCKLRVQLAVGEVTLGRLIGCCKTLYTQLLYQLHRWMRFEGPVISKTEFRVRSTQSDYTTMPRSNNATGLRRSGNSPSDQPPMLIDTSTQGNLLSNFRTRRLSKSNFCEILLVSNVVSRGLCSTALTLRTLPPVEVDPILTIKTSCFASFETFVCFLSSHVALTPSNLS
jgi:hypothetical protein